MIVFDSSFLLAALNTDSPDSAEARRLWEQLLSGRWGRGLLLDTVFSETIETVQRLDSGGKAPWLGQYLLRSHELEFVPASDVFSAAWQEFQLRPQLPLRFVDYAAAHVARQRAGGKLLTFNPGFAALPGLKVERL